MTYRLLPLLPLLALAACASDGGSTSSAPASATAAPTAAAAPAPAPTVTPPPVAAAPAPPSASVAAATATSGKPPEAFTRVCSGCHSPELVADKRMDREGWTQLVHTMIGMGAVASDAEIKQIVDYLAATYPPGA